MSEAPKDPNAQKIAALIAEHGPVAQGTTPSGTQLVFRAPTLDEWEDHQENLASGKKRRYACFREIAQLTVLLPNLEGLKGELERYPAMGLTIHNALAELVGADVEFTVKKG